MAAHDHRYLELLESLGIAIAPEDWDRVHGGGAPAPAPERPILPDRPDHYDAEGTAVFTQGQLDWADPGLWGFEAYEVVMDRDTEQPFALEWKDEVACRRDGRPVHRYNRAYRLKWTLEHLVGLNGKDDAEAVERLEAALREERRPREFVRSRRIHEWVRAQLKRWGRRDLYLSASALVRRLGGPAWRVPEGTLQRVVEGALALHRVFDRLGPELPRRRFPKMQYVLLRLLDGQGAVPPYKILWARTSIKRRQLSEFLASLARHLDRDPWGHAALLYDPSPPAGSGSGKP